MIICKRTICLFFRIFRQAGHGAGSAEPALLPQPPARLHQEGTRLHIPGQRRHVIDALKGGFTHNYYFEIWLPSHPNKGFGAIFFALFGYGHFNTNY